MSRGIRCCRFYYLCIICPSPLWYTWCAHASSGTELQRRYVAWRHAVKWIKIFAGKCWWWPMNIDSEITQTEVECIGSIVSVYLQCRLQIHCTYTTTCWAAYTAGTLRMLQCTCSVHCMALQVHSTLGIWSLGQKPIFLANFWWLELSVRRLSKLHGMVFEQLLTDSSDHVVLPHFYKKWYFNFIWPKNHNPCVKPFGTARWNKSTTRFGLFGVHELR